ncbi:Arm DNA-binding domain-containing protein [Cohnella cellulosilytica]|uniref:site-specific integrase n=1 Tax=Cohnella cellulosilytica TaxID=986710 RepID=UPI0036149FAC
MASYRKRGCKCPKNRKCTCGATWEFRISVTDPATGERSQPGDSGFKTKEEAKQAAADLKRKYNSGILSASAKDETVESFMKKFLQNVLVNEVEENTLEQKFAQMEKYIVPKLGRIHLKKLNPAQVQKFITDLGEGDLVAGTIINIVRLLNQTLNKALEWGYIDRNVASMVSKPKYKPEKFQVWTKQHFEYFLQNTKNSRLYPFYLLGLTTGMRPGEITALTWNHINFRSKTIRVEQTVAWKRKRNLYKNESEE